jgi:chemotaxis protein MotB
VSKEKRPIIIVKKKKVHGGGHHGGSWKVAYADFVTAMMAFFMVMWILGMNDQAKEAVEGYFSNPVGYKKGYSSGTSPLSSGNSPGQVRSAPMRLIMRSYQQERFEQVGDRIRTRIESARGLGSIAAQVEIIVSNAGLRIELIEGAGGETFFAFGSAVLKPPARIALELIAHELGELSNPVIIEGHTDAALFGRSGYTNWELSADRANAARRVLHTAGLGTERIREVRGHADRDLRVPDNPLDPANRRISIFLPFTTPPDLKVPELPVPVPGKV